VKLDNRAMDNDVGEAVIYIGYGDLMRKLQLMEWNLWEIQARRMKPKIRAEDAFAKLEKLDATTFGSLVRGMQTQDHWPAGIVDELLAAVDLRNHLAHHFLREFFLAEQSEENYTRGADQLAEWSLRVDDLDERLDAHIQTMSDVTWDELDEDLKAEIEAMRPTTWPLISPDEDLHQDDSR
jgi:hypothetical protein